MSTGAVVTPEQASVDAAGVALCEGCYMEEGAYHEEDCEVAHPPDLEEKVQALDLPMGRACRCGERMELDRVEPAGETKIVVWSCRCGRQFGAQVEPETQKVRNTQWEGP